LSERIARETSGQKPFCPKGGGGGLPPQKGVSMNNLYQKQVAKKGRTSEKGRIKKKVFWRSCRVAVKRTKDEAQCHG